MTGFHLGAFYCLLTSVPVANLIERHDLVKRAKQGVELMYYCFLSLKLLHSPEYSFHHALGEHELAESTNLERRRKLDELYDTFMPIYADCFNLV